MKHHLLILAVSIMFIAIRRYGWRDDPKPEPYTTNSNYPWWRSIGDHKIEVSSFAGAVSRCLKEMSQQTTNA